MLVVGDVGAVPRLEGGGVDGDEGVDRENLQRGRKLTALSASCAAVWRGGSSVL